MNFIKSKCFGSGVHLLPCSVIHSPRARPSSWERGHRRPAVEVVHTVVATSVQPGKLGGVDRERKDRARFHAVFFAGRGGEHFCMVQ